MRTSRSSVDRKSINAVEEWPPWLYHKLNFSIESLQAPVQTCYWHQADNICEGYSVKTRQGKNLQSLCKELIPLPNVFVQDIPQEAETTGNVCPASSLLHACTYIYSRWQNGHNNMSGCFHGVKNDFIPYFYSQWHIGQWQTMTNNITYSMYTYTDR